MGVLRNSPLLFLGILAIFVIIADAKRVNRLSSRNFDPMVAFVCNRSAMFNTPDGGWVSDPSTDCLKTSKEIVQYCQKIFPRHKVTHFRVSSSRRIIPGWCVREKDHCKGFDKFSIQPFLCLSGPIRPKSYEIPSLVVPAHCHFDHKHDPTKCEEYDVLARSAKSFCTKDYKMKIQSFAMLSPCEVSGKKGFTGVEFVCCPQTGAPPPVVSIKVISSQDSVTHEKEVTHAGLAKTDISKVKGKKSKKVDSDKEGQTLAEKYLHEKIRKAQYFGEHKLFQTVKAYLNKERKDKIDRVMKGWEKAKKVITSLKSMDPTKSGKMNRDQSSVFQKELSQIEAEADHQLDEAMKVHQAHVYANLNEKKREVLSKFISRLEMYKPSQEKSLLRALQKYLYLEQKDAKHCIQHYKVVRTNHPELAFGLIKPTIHHLQTISKRMNQSINLLNRLEDPKIIAHLKSEVHSWFRSQFADIDMTIRKLIFTLKSQPDNAVKPFFPTRTKGSDGKERLVKPFVYPVKPVEKLGLEVFQEKPKEPHAIKVFQETPQKPGIDVYQELPEKDKMDDKKPVEDDGKVSGHKEIKGSMGPLEQIGSYVKTGLKKWADAARWSNKLKQEKKIHMNPDSDKPRKGFPVAPKKAWGAVDDLITEDEHDYMKKPVPKLSAKEKLLKDMGYDAFGPSVAMAKSNHNSASEDSILITKSDKKPHVLSPGTVIAVVSSLIAAVIIVVVIVVVVRARRNEPKGPTEYEEVAREDMTPEEMHVKKMQMNGYENPTYKFLERQK